MRRARSLVAIGLLVVTCLASLVGPLAVSAESKGGARIAFFGEVESCPADGGQGLWSIGGREVLVVESTRIMERWGEAEVGAFVLVGARVLADGSLEAALIHVQPPAFQSLDRLRWALAQGLALRQRSGTESQEGAQHQTRAQEQTQSQARTQAREQKQDQTQTQEQTQDQTRTQARDGTCTQTQSQTRAQDGAGMQARTGGR